MMLIKNKIDPRRMRKKGNSSKEDEKVNDYLLPGIQNDLVELIVRKYLEETKASIKQDVSPPATLPTYKPENTNI